MDEDSSLMTVTQLMIAPEITPESIIGTVISTNERISEAPSETAASSMDGLIWLMMAVLERIVYGMRRTASDMMMMTAVPVSASGGLAKAYRKQMPSTEPGMM